MTVKNFPMGSILGQKFGEHYSTNSKAAAEAALSADGVAYIHCYLGLHRARNVQRYLAEHAQVQAQTYATTGAGASEITRCSSYVSTASSEFLMRSIRRWISWRRSARLWTKRRSKAKA